MAKFSWNEENTAQLVALADSIGGQVSQENLVTFAEEIGTTNRSVGSKLRKMGYDVQKASEVATVSAWTDEERDALVQFVNDNAGVYTYGEISELFAGGKFGPRAVQGKILSLELTGSVKPTEKKETPKKYSAEQEAQFIALLEEGAYLEDIAEALGVTVQSARGKALSLTQKNEGLTMPKQKISTAKAKTDALADIEDVASMTIEDLVNATGHTARGLKSMLSRRGISCADYDGAAKRAKLDAAAEAA